MPRPKDAKIWNEDLIAALDARHQKSLREGKRDAHTWRVGMEKIQAVRRDIYQFRTGSIANLPTGLTKKVQRLCEDVIRGVTNVYPDGHVPTNGAGGGASGRGGGIGRGLGGGFGAIDMTGDVGFGRGGYALNAFGDRIGDGYNPRAVTAAAAAPAAAAAASASNNPFANDHYMKSMKIRGGAYAILMAFHHSQTDVLRKAQICREGQPFCDDQMESNYLAGRMYGAWKSIDTLKSHHLVTEQGFAAHTPGRGFRDRPHEYTLTRDGKMFVEALLTNRPEAAAAARQAVGGGAAAAAAPLFGAAAFGELFGGNAGSPFRSSSGSRLSGTLNRVPQFARGDIVNPGRSSCLADGDRAELENWVATAEIGDQKDFNVGKDRRKALHRTCDKLQEDNPGLLLTHSSTGTARQRILAIQVVATPSASAATGRKRPSSPGMPSNFSGYGQSPAKALSPATKRPRELGPAQNAALAAMRRQEQAKVDEDLKRAIAESTKLAETPPRYKSFKCGECEDEIQDIDADDDEEIILQRALKESLIQSSKKPAATRRQRSSSPFSTRNAHDEKKPSAEPYAIESSDSDSDDELLKGAPIFSLSHQPKKDKNQKNPTRKDGSRAARKIDLSQSDDDINANEEKKDSVGDDCVIEIEDSQDEPIDLLDSQPQAYDQNSSDDSDDGDDVVIVHNASFDDPPPVESLTPNASPLGDYSLKVMIDNRERNRNATPRTLRMELARHLTSGALRDVWPNALPGTIPPAQVEEVGLEYGDFGYSLTRIASGESCRLGVSVERKRVNDLVQRSYDGDHFSQLFRMQQHCSLSILLIEYNTRMTSSVTAYNAQNRDGFDPFDTTITCEEDVYRMFGRLILCSNSIKFIQTKDEQATLRAIGALGLMTATGPRAYTCKRSSATSSDSGDRYVGTQALTDQLKQGGIPWLLAQRVARATGGSEQLEALYHSCCNEKAKSMLLSHLMSISDEDQADLQSSAPGWSDAIYRIVMASKSASRPSSITSFTGESALLLHKHMVQDHGRYLSMLYGGCSPEEALDRTLSTPDTPVSPAGEAARSVSIQLTKDQAAKYFPSGGSGAFYKLSVVSSTENEYFSAPTNISPIVMRTVCGSLASKKLRIYELEGSELAERIQHACGDGEIDFVAIAKEIGQRLDIQCQPQGTATSTMERRILLICGMQAAMDCIAKKADYRPEMRTMLDMVLCDVMIRYNITVIQAVRKKEEDRVNVVRQLALACLHYGYLVASK